MAQTRVVRLMLMLVLTAIVAGALTGCRVMSWNLHGVCGIYGNCDADQAPRTEGRWATVIANQGFPGVIGLQEVCEGPGRRDLSELVFRLADAGQYYYYYFKTTHEDSDKYHHCGNAILSVLPLRNRSCIWLSFDPVRTCSTGPQPPSDCVPEDCRVAMSAIVDVRTPNGTVPVRVFNAHTAGGAYSFDSPRQTQAVASWVANFGDTGAKVVTGDFQNGNAFHPVFQTFWNRGFASAVNSDGRTPLTYSQDSERCPAPAGELGIKPDYIWTNLSLTDWYAPCVTSGTSDHFPLVADLKDP
jgi:endonuclease/exonuclease/phosphatase family metal-dependent hydrolase